LLGHRLRFDSPCNASSQTYGIFGQIKLTTIKACIRKKQGFVSNTRVPQASTFNHSLDCGALRGNGVTIKALGSLSNALDNYVKALVPQSKPLRLGEGGKASHRILAFFRFPEKAIN
jgi:hypothetical protein